MLSLLHDMAKKLSTEDKKKKELEKAARDAVKKEAFRLEQGEPEDDIDENVVREIAGNVAENIAAMEKEEIENLRHEFAEAVTPSQEELQKADNEVSILIITAGEMEDGKPFYAYLSVKPSKYKDFMEAEKKGNYKLSDFGEILEFGREKEPPENVKKEMEEKYGASHTFEEDFIKSLQNYLKEKD